MTGFIALARNLLKGINAAFRGRQISVAVLMLAVLIPIGAPVPAAANGLDAAAFVEGSLTFASSASLSAKAALTSFGDKLTKAGGEKANADGSFAVGADAIPEMPAEDAIAPAVESNTRIEAALALNLPVNEQESLFYPANNLGAPAGKTEQSSPVPAAAARMRERNGVGNFSFDLGFASLPGRGISASAGATYNSRVWNKSYDTANSRDRYTYDVDENWLAPGFTVGYGSIEGSGQTPGYLKDSSGNRHKLYYNSTLSTTNVKVYDARDGSFIRVFTDATPNRQRTYARFSNGSTIHFDYYANADGRRRATAFADNNGNYFQIAYVQGDTAGRISFLQDMLGRYIKFNYNASQKLVSVSVPEYGNTATPPAERETIRFYYENMTLDPRFAGTVDGAGAPVSVLKYVYFPATKSGYKYEYSPMFGMIYKITRFEGMALSTDGLSVQSDGQWAAKTEYGYPINQSDVPNPGVLQDVPKYETRIDDWIGRPGTSAPLTRFLAIEDTVNEITTSTITSPDQTITKTVLNKKTDQSSWDNGLVKETSVTSASAQLMQKSVLAWDTLSTANPRLEKAENTNEAGQVNAVRYQSYDQYNNVLVMSVHDFAAAGAVGAELKRVETTYETGAVDPGWINRRLVHLPKSVKVYEGTNIVSRVDYEYDSNGDGTQLLRRDDIGDGHFREYNPYLPPLQTCEQPDESGEIYCITMANYDPGTDYRGNVTKVTSWANAANPVDLLRETQVMKYDVAGNLVEATMNCCQLRKWVYELSNKYAYPVEVNSGANGEFSKSAEYDYNTGLTKKTFDENNQPTEYQYEPDTLRAKKTIYPNGGYTENFYSDTVIGNPQLVPGYVQTKTTLEAGKLAESYSYFDGRGLGTSSASKTPDGWSVSAVEYDNMGRPVKTYNPFYATTPNETVPGGTKFTEVAAYDAIGRATQVKMQDGTSVFSYPNEEIATVTYPDATEIKGTVSRAKDQADKERRQIVDALGRVIRVDEPTTGGLGTIAAPNQPTFYNYDGNDNLAKVIQSDGTVTQERRFKYDSMSRLTHEKQVEANPTLDVNGNYGAPDPNKWTKVLKYDAFGRLKEGIDARGAKTEFKKYDAVNRIEWITFSDGTPEVKYYYDQARTGFYNSKALTRVETVPVAATPSGTMATATEFDYDQMGRVSKQRQTIGAETYNLEYGYNLAGQLTSQKYPSGKIVTTSYDANGRLSTIADGSRTYLSGMQYLGKGNSMSQMTLGNGTTETFTLNDRLQMSGQELKKGSDVLQKYDYGFGELDSQGILKNNGKLESVVSHVGTAKQWTQKFKYDEIGRLSETEERRGDTNALSYKQKFDFDRFGNMYRKTASNPTAGQATPLLFTPIEETTAPGTGDIEKQTNRFRTETTYDDAGNVTTDNKFRDSSFSYDANGRMIKATRANVPDALSVYDASGMRVAEKVNNIWRYLVYDIGGKLIAEYGGPAQTGDGGIKYVLQDWQGSTRATLNNSGFVKSRSDYTAFGEDISSGTGQRTSAQGFESANSLRQKYGLTERDDATGLDHTWFRKNENQAGRWTSPDPYNGSMNLGNPQSFNRYSYVENEPTNFIDPSGLQLRYYDVSRGLACVVVDGVNRCTEYIDRYWYDDGTGNGVSGEGFDAGGVSDDPIQDEFSRRLDQTDCRQKLQKLFKALGNKSTVDNFANQFFDGTNGKQIAFGNPSNPDASASYGDGTITIRPRDSNEPENISLQSNTTNFIHELIHAIGGRVGLSHRRIYKAIARIDGINFKQFTKERKQQLKQQNSKNKDRDSAMYSNAMNEWINKNCGG